MVPVVMQQVTGDTVPCVEISTRNTDFSSFEASSPFNIFRPAFEAANTTEGDFFPLAPSLLWLLRICIQLS